MKEVSWKNKLKFVKDVPMMCVNVIVNVMVVPEKRKGFTFVQRFCTIEMLSYNCVTNRGYCN
jgi:hypothetical protein